MKSLLSKLLQSALLALLTVLFLPTQTLAHPPKKVLMVVTSHAQLGDTGEKTGYWLSELTHPYFEIKKAGVEIDIASIAGGKAPIDPKSLKQAKDDVSDQTFLTKKPYQKAIAHTLKLSEVKPSDYQAIVFAGGHGTMWDFPDSKAVQESIRIVYENDGVVAAVCHGPAALVNAKLSNGKYLVEGKKLTAFTNAEEDALGLTKAMPFLLETKLKERGAKFSNAAPWQADVVVDGTLVTGQNPASAKGLGEQVAKLLKHD